MMQGAAPFVESGELVFLFFIPLGTTLKVVLEPQTTADRAPTGQMLRNVLPLHAITTQLDDRSVFVVRPFRLLLLRW